MGLKSMKSKRGQSRWQKNSARNKPTTRNIASMLKCSVRLLRPLRSSVIVIAGNCYLRENRLLHCWNLPMRRVTRGENPARFPSTLMSIPTVCYEFCCDMAVLDILKYPESVLGQPSLPVKNITGETVRLVTDLIDTMYAAPGVGLAAPQIGASERIIVLDVDHENPGKQVYKLINPVIKRAEGEVIWEEGCLSVVDFTAEVRRAAQVEVKSTTLKQPSSQ